MCFVLLASERFDLFGFFWEMWVSVPVWLILGPIRCDGHVFAHFFDKYCNSSFKWC